MGILIVLVVLALAAAVIYGCYRIASKKGRNPALWAVLGFFFGVIALAIVALLPSKASA